MRLDEAHGVQDGETGRDRATRGVDVDRDIPVGILGLQKEHLSDHEIGQRIVDRLADEDDAVLEQARVNVVGALAPARLLDDHWNQRHSIYLNPRIEY